MEGNIKKQGDKPTHRIDIFSFVALSLYSLILSLITSGSVKHPPPVTMNLKTFLPFPIMAAQMRNLGEIVGQWDVVCLVLTYIKVKTRYVFLTNVVQDPIAMTGRWCYGRRLQMHAQLARWRRSVMNSWRI